MGKHVVAVKSRDVTHAKLLVPAALRGDFVAPALAYATVAAALVNRALPRVPLAITAGVAVAAHVLLLLCAHWFVTVAAALRYRPSPDAAAATHALVTPAQFAGAPALLPLQRRSGDGGAELFFEFRKARFVWDGDEGVFRQQRYPTALPFARYAASRGLATPGAVAAAAAAYGRNSFALPAPRFRDLLLQQLSAPWFVFQLFCCALWCLDEYWHYSVLTLLMLVVFEATVVKTRMRTAEDLRSHGAPPQPLRALRHGAWVPLAAAELLPGDIVSVGRPRGPDADRAVVPADLLLLSGSVITEEALLTGESAPQWKSAAPCGDVAKAASEGDGDTEGAAAVANGGETMLDLKRHRQHIIFGGTKLVQHTEERSAAGGGGLRTPDGGCVAYVLRTGFGTEQGKLMRTILFSAETVSANSREAGLFILLLLAFALAAAGYVLYHGLADERRSRWKLFLHCTMVLTSVIPPELPMELTIAVNTSLLALSRLGIYCTEPFRIPLAGALDVCAFDKTGTLTSDELRFDGVLPGGADADDDDSAAAAAAAPPLRGARELPPGAGMCLGACHALVMVDGALAGDPLERAALGGLGWRYGGNDLATPPREAGPAAPSVRILRRLHFTPELRRMLVVAAPAGREAEPGVALVLVKGAPEAVLPLCAPDSLPRGCGRVYRQLAARGARVLALAWRPLAAEEPWRAAPREVLETGLRFAGFALFGCPLRPSSAAALAALRRGRHAVVMLTGDAPLTACHVARQTNIVTRQLLLLTAQPGGGGFEWQTPTGAAVEPLDAARIAALGATHDLCVGGDGLAAATAARALDVLVRHTQVYARCAPEQKEAVLRALRAAGLSTLMCGDGTNDVGALKAAAVGVALVAASAAAPGSDAAELQLLSDDTGGRLPPMVRLGDASMAAPFTAKVPSVAACVHVVRQGRATLTTTVQMFKILGLNCLVSAFALSVQYLDGVKWGDTQATVAGLASAALFMLLALGKAASRLARERPHAGVFCAYALLSIAVQAAAHLALLWRAAATARQLEGPPTRHPDDDFAPGMVNSAAFLATSALQLNTFGVNYIGAPFATPLRKHKPLLYSLLFGYAALALAASGAAPPLAAALELAPLPAQVRDLLFAGAAADLLLCATAERALRAALPARPAAAALRLSPGV